MLGGGCFSGHGVYVMKLGLHFGSFCMYRKVLYLVHMGLVFIWSCFGLCLWFFCFTSPVLWYLQKEPTFSQLDWQAMRKQLLGIFRLIKFWWVGSERIISAMITFGCLINKLWVGDWNNRDPNFSTESVRWTYHAHQKQHSSTKTGSL